MMNFSSPTEEGSNAVPLYFALEAASIGVWEWVPATGSMNCNARARSLCGLGPEVPATLDAFLACLHPEDRSRLRAAMVQAADEGSSLRGECRVLHTSVKAERWLLIEGGKCVPSDGAVHIAGTVRDISERKEADADHALVVRELEHRVHNVFAVIGAVVSLTERTAGTSEQMAHALRRRIDALGRANGPVSGSDTSARVHLQQILEAELAAFSDLTAVRMSGPPITLGRNQTVAMHLIAHELTTNALKYGALSRPDGHLQIHWCIERREQTDCLALRWKETCRGGAVAAGRAGFGSRLLSLCARVNLGGDIVVDYEGDGARIELVVPIARLT